MDEFTGQMLFGHPEQRLFETSASSAKTGSKEGWEESIPYASWIGNNIYYLLPINIVAERVVRYLSGVRGQISLLV